MHFRAYMLDVYTNFVYPVEIFVKDDLIEDVIPIVTDKEHDVDFEGILLPGFIDAHIHIESSMIIPSEFAKNAVKHGTTSVIADPHEIANVWGVEGIKSMIENANSTPLDFYFTAPSCVPSTSFETSGSRLDIGEIEELFLNEKVIALGEVMNFEGVINEDIEILNKIDLAHSYQKLIDGHAPLLTGKDLEKYVSRGIYTDHECSSFDEAIEKKKLGMKIMVREGSSAKNMESLFNYDDRINFLKKEGFLDELNYEDFEEALERPIFDFLVCDDKNPNDLLEGHLDSLIKKARSLGIDVIEAIKMVTINPATYYGLNSGAISNGKKANFVLVDSLDELNIKKTFINGKLVYDGEKVLFDGEEFPYKNSFNINHKKSSDFDIEFKEGNDVGVRSIEVFDGEIITSEIDVNLDVLNNVILPDLDNDILKISVVERYGGNSIGNAFIKGFNLKNAAIASSVSHDSHNIVVVGTSSKLMADVTNLIIKNHGGLAITWIDEDGNQKEDILKLPIAGLMSSESCEDVAIKLDELHEIARNLGCKLESPFMSLSFLALLVIPSLKLSNKGLFDVNNFSFVDVIKE